MLYFKCGDKVIVNNPISCFYKKEGVVKSCGTKFCRISIPTDIELSLPPDWLDYATDEKIKHLSDDDKALILSIIPGKWVAYDENGMYFSAFANNASPIFNTKGDIIADISSVHLDGRKHKTVTRKSPGCYWYSFRDIDTKEPRCFVIERVTAENLNRMREYCIAGLCPADYK